MTSRASARRRWRPPEWSALVIRSQSQAGHQCSPTAATWSMRLWRWPSHVADLARAVRIGGDAFAVVREPDGPYGPSTAAVTEPRRYAGHLPRPGPLGDSVGRRPRRRRAGCTRGPCHAPRVRATIPLADLWEPAARIAERGLPCSAKTRADVQAALQAIVPTSGSRRYIPRERRPTRR